MINLQKLRKALADEKRPYPARLILEWQNRQALSLTDFRRHLWEALDTADDTELAQMARAFPHEVQAIRLYRTTWIGQQLQDEGLLLAS